MKSSSNIRINLILLLFILVSIVLVAKLYYLQIIYGDKFSEMGDRQYTKPNSNIFNRGTIYFQTKDGVLVPAATLKSGYIIAVNPQILSNAIDTYDRLSQYLKIDKDKFITGASNKKLTYFEIARKVNEKDATIIDNFGIKGLNIYKEKWRYYPGGRLASNVLGLLAHGKDGYAGQYGLERYYEDVLGRKEGRSYVNFFAEIFSSVNDLKDGKNIEGDIETTIEPNVQAYLESLLAKTNNKWEADHTGAVIINPQNGEIYAMGNYPSFDPNSFRDEEDVKIFSNPIIENVYEMGSIIKPFTLSSAIDVGAITASTTYFDSGSLVVNNSKISNFDGKGRGLVDMQTVLSQSLNTGTAFAERRMGNATFSKYFKEFGLGMETGIDLPNEGYGLIKNLESPRDIEYVTASFGQGIAMTPIATIRGLSALANGGNLISPHIVKKINYKIGGSKETFIGLGKRVIKPETSKEIARMMTWSVDNVLRDGKMKIKNYSVAVKTGTAQIAKENDRGYYEGKSLHTFFGFVPANNAKFLIFFFMINPGKNIKYSSETLTEPFFETTKYLINYYEIPPDR